MPGCRPFSVSFEGDGESLFQKAKVFAESNGGQITGDAERGSFSARIMGISKFAGSYVITDQTMTVTITDRPVLLSCSVIETAVRDKLRGR